MNNNVDQLLKLVGENESLKGSFIEDVLLAMQSGKCDDVDMEVDIEAGEKVIGEMNDLEKALKSIADQCGVDEHQMVEQFKAEGPDNPIDPEIKKNMIFDLDQIRERFKAANQLLWASIEKRFYHLDEEKSTGTGIRSGFKVVNLFEEEGSVAHISVVGLFGGRGTGLFGM
ncbi:MAG: hypothetical protein ABH884_02335 [Candidatus Komeilibacteria bacterium]